MRIAVDLEGVLAGTHNAFLEHYNQEFGTNFSEEDINNWGFGKLRRHFNEVYDLEEDNQKAFLTGHGKWDGFVEVSERIWRDTPEDIPSLFDNVPEAFRENHTSVDIVTARRNVRRQLLRWLEANGIKTGLDFDRLRVEKDKHRLEYDVFVDDNPVLHQNLTGTGKKGIVIEQPWNQNEDTGESVKIQGIESIGEVINDLD